MCFVILVVVVNIYFYGDWVEYDIIESLGLVVILLCYCV